MSSSQLHQKAATAVLILGGLFVGACGAHAADAAPTASATERSAQAQTESCANCAGRKGEHHAEMQAALALAQALGMTVEELRAEMDAGKRPPQIARERGFDFAKVREAMLAPHGERGHRRTRYHE
jgi:cytochrome c553